MKKLLGIALALALANSAWAQQINSGGGAGGGGGGTGTVTSVGAGCGTSTGGSPITTTGNVVAAMTVRANTATSDTIVAADCGNLLTEANASPVATAIAQAGTPGFASGAFFNVCNKGAGAVTITPATSTIGGASTYVLGAGTAAAPICVGIVSDGTNYQVMPSSGGSGGTPGGSANQIQYNSGGVSFAGFTMSGDCTLTVATGVIVCTKTNNVSFAASATTDTTNASNIASGNLPILRSSPGVSHPGYGSGVWYPTFRSSFAGGPPVANTTAYCSIFQIGGNAAVSIQALGVRTTVNGTNLQLALYNSSVTSAGSRPTTLIGSTANITATSFGNLPGALIGGPFSLNPGFYWACIQTDNGAVRFQAAGSTGADQSYFQGGTTLALAGGTNTALGVSAASGGFGTWPSPLVTFTELTSAGATPPAISIQIQ